MCGVFAAPHGETCLALRRGSCAGDKGFQSGPLQYGCVLGTMVSKIREDRKRRAQEDMGLPLNKKNK